MNDKRYTYNLLSLAIYVILTIPGWVREFSNFSKNSPFGNWAPFIIVLLILLWISFHNLFLVHKLLSRGRYLVYALTLILSICLMAIFHLLVSEPFSFYWAFVNILIHTALCSTLYMSIAFIDQKRLFYKQSIISREIELNQLKAQLNPHFLFNALNNIYSYNLENDKKGNDLILKLSQLMRYIVEVNSKKTVSIYEELQFISDYVALEKERLGQRCEVIFHVDCPNKYIQLEPLLFFPLVENAFKHSASTNARSMVEIDIRQQQNELLVRVANNKSEGTHRDSMHVGINNVRRRLELIYPGRHEFSVTSNGDRFCTVLKFSFK